MVQSGVSLLIYIFESWLTFYSGMIAGCKYVRKFACSGGRGFCACLRCVELAPVDLHGPETLASLVASSDSLFSRIEVNTRELFALLKVRATLTSEYRIVRAKLEEKRADPSNTFGPPLPSPVRARKSSKGKGASWW